MGALLAAVALLTSAGAAFADDPSASASPAEGESAAPTEAGTTFRTATAVRQGQAATADASTGDYLYWAFPADSGQRPTVRAKVSLPESATRHGASTWQIDVYDGLRRSAGLHVRPPDQEGGAGRRRPSSCPVSCVRSGPGPSRGRPTRCPAPTTYA